jgi:hypothetical protein
LTGLSKWLMILGAIVFAIGFLSQFIKIGKLPGDILIKKGNATFYFPLMTSIIVSIALSVIFWFLGKFR